MIIAMDADTFAPKGGDPYYALAQEAVNVAQSAGYKGWSQSDGNQNRYFLSNDLFSKPILLFAKPCIYHFQGIDQMAKDQQLAKEKVIEAVKKLAEIHKVRPNAF
jgi:hypothetical protein